MTHYECPRPRHSPEPVEGPVFTEKPTPAPPRQPQQEAPKEEPEFFVATIHESSRHYCSPVFVERPVPTEEKKAEKVETETPTLCSPQQETPKESIESVGKEEKEEGNRGQELTFCEPKNEAQRTLFMRTSVYSAYGPSRDEKLLGSVKEKLNETVGEGNYVVLGLDKDVVVLKIGLKHGAK